MLIYIDEDYKCYVTDDGTRHAFDVPNFNGKCPAYIEGCRYVPPGERWVKPNGEFFKGEMLTFWKDSQAMEALQAAYEEGQATSGTDEEKQDMQAALELLGVNVNG